MSGFEGSTASDSTSCISRLPFSLICSHVAPASVDRKIPSSVPAKSNLGLEGACTKARIDLPCRPATSLHFLPRSWLTHRPPSARFHAATKIVAGSAESTTMWSRIRSSAVSSFTSRCHVTPASSDSQSEEHTSELQSLRHLVCRLLLVKKK